MSTLNFEKPQSFREPELNMIFKTAELPRSSTYLFNGKQDSTLTRPLSNSDLARDLGRFKCS
jgi:hypothetical protein